MIMNVENSGFGELCPEQLQQESDKKSLSICEEAEAAIRENEESQQKGK